MHECVCGVVLITCTLNNKVSEICKIVNGLRPALQPPIFKFSFLSHPQTHTNTLILVNFFIGTIVSYTY